MASPCEICFACEMRFARKEANFISHCDEGAIFHNFRQEIISYFAARQNISLKIKNSEYHSEYAKNYFTFGAHRIFHLKNLQHYDIITTERRRFREISPLFSNFHRSIFDFSSSRRIRTTESLPPRGRWHAKRIVPFSFTYGWRT